VRPAETPSLIQKIRLPPIGFFRSYIAMRRCRIESIWGILWVCVLTQRRPSCIPTCRNFPGPSFQGILLFFPLVLLRMGRFKYGLFDCSGDCGMCSLTERDSTHFFMLNHEQISNWSQQLTFSYRNSEIRHGHSPCRLVWSCFQSLSCQG